MKIIKKKTDKIWGISNIANVAYYKNRLKPTTGWLF
jgi:hypothetical protein